MLEVGIVDDEISVLEELKGIIDWETYGLNISGMFSSPTDALEYVKSHPIDIIISDISMPVLNGIALAKQVLLEQPDIKIIFLTAYEDFSYAKEAIRMGVKNYLIKPVSGDELLLTVNRITQELLQKTRMEKYVNDLKYKADLSTVILQEKFFQWLVSRNTEISNSAVKSKFTFYNIPISTEIYQVLVLEISPKQEEQLQEDFFYTSIKKTIQNALDDYTSYYIFSNISELRNRICILFELPDQKYTLKYDMELVAKKLRDVIRLDLGIDVFIGCGNIYCGPAEIKKSYYEAVYALKHNVFLNSSETVLYAQIIRNVTDITFDQQKLRSRMINHLRCQDAAAIQNELQNLHKSLLFCGYPFEYIRLIYIDLIISSIIFLREIDYSPSDIFDKHFDPTEIMSRLTNLQQCNEWTSTYFKKIIDFICDGKLDPHHNLVKNVMKEVENNISNMELSVKFLAGQFYINEDHLSLIFKQIIGVPLKKYIGDMKLNYAKENIDGGLFNIGEVSEKSGFSDALYFSKCFKKKFGIAPSEYISRRKRGR